MDTDSIIVEIVCDRIGQIKFVQNQVSRCGPTDCEIYLTYRYKFAGYKAAAASISFRAYGIS